MHDSPQISTARQSAASVRDYFRATFGREAHVVASAPGRVNLIGEHTDYNGGDVLPIAIDRRTYVAIAPGGGGALTRAASATESALGELDATRPQRGGGWWDYIAGVLEASARHGVTVPQLDIAVTSDVPIGAGLSSSAALEVAAGAAIHALAAVPVSWRDLALIGWEAETQFVGVQSGIMDQFASALGEAGEALYLQCDTLQTELVPFAESVLIFDTATPRSLRTSQFNVRRAECEAALQLLRVLYPDLPNLAAATPEQLLRARLPEPLDRRALHVVEETRRVRQAVDALRSDGTIPGALLYQSHESLRVLYEASTPELDWFVEHAAKVPGVRGARLTGAGWGGCAIAVGEPEALRGAIAPLARQFEQVFGRAPRAWLTSASAGVREEDRVHSTG